MQKFKNQFRKISEIYRPFKKAIILIGLMMLGAQLADLAAPYIFGRIIDALNQEKSFAYLSVLALIFLSSKLIERFFALMRSLWDIKNLEFGIEQHIDAITLSRISRLSLGQINNQNSGFKHDIIRKGENAIIEIVNLVYFDVGPALLKTFTAIVAIVFVEARLCPLVVGSITVFLFFSIRLNREVMPHLRENTKLGNKAGTTFWESIKNLGLVILNNQEKKASEKYLADYTKFAVHGIDVWTKYLIKTVTIRDPWLIIGQFGSLLFGIYLVSTGEITPGKLVTVLGMTSLAFGSLDRIGSAQRRISSYWARIGRYFDLLDMPPSVVNSDNPIRPAKFRGKIEFKNVSFKYPTFTGNSLGDEEEETMTKVEDPNLHAIQNISFTIEPGETCAFVGPSGSGKSTVVNLLMRCYDPDEGEILIDGYNLRDIDLKCWRNSVGYVEQRPRLWDDTLRENILYALEEGVTVSEEELRDLAEKTKISEFYHRLDPSDPFSTQIGENGVQLSGGQCQRVAIARAMAKKPRTLIFDEATNALDTMNEKAISEAIGEALKGRTGIIIAHRLSTVRHADKIIVFKKGRVVGIDKHDDLMESCPSYRELVEYEIATLTNGG